MATRIEGIYRNGRIELQQLPANIPEDTRAIVTFIDPNGGEIDLSAYLPNQDQAELLREGLAAFSEDWNSPSMDIYDNYDATKSNS